jgi:hypothetical protein
MMEIVRRAKKLYRQTALRWRHHGIKTASEFAGTHLKYNLLQRQILRKDVFDGVHPYDQEWDVLIVLDAFRADLFRKIVKTKNYEFVEQCDDITSIAGKSLGWLRTMFDTNHLPEVKETAYVTANPHTDIVFSEAETVSKDDFALLDEVWKYGWDEDIGTVLAETVTDRAIDIWRSSGTPSLIIHYIQPHFPSVPYPDLGSKIDLEMVGETWPDSIWERAIRGKVSDEKIWEAYESNGKYVMDNLKTLLTNIDTDHTVITADHGNAVGERGFYGHGGYPVHEVREVPWCYASATDNRTYQPDIDPSQQSLDGSVSDRLKSLGYIN